MNAVIVCATVWMHFVGPTALTDAQSFMETYPQEHTLASCKSPVEATDEDVAFYKGKDFKPMKISNIDQLKEAGQTSEETLDKVETSEAAPERTEVVETPASEKKCHYWFVRIAPHVLQMKSRCWVQKVAK